MHVIEYPVSFGDCDPAGIVFYPHVYAWFDRTFHDWLRPYGGHEEVCRRLSAVGLGLMEASARFRRPMRDGDVLAIALAIEKWGARTLHLAYEVRIGEQIAVAGVEVRGLFRREGAAIVAADIETLRDLVGGHA